MTKLKGASSEQLANHFVNYLFKEYSGSLHVRRVASWIGLIVLGIEKIIAQPWKIPRTRQLKFEFNRRSFKGKYNHKAGTRGGTDIVEVLPGRGSPEGQTVVSITSLKEAEHFYKRSQSIFKKFTS